MKALLRLLLGVALALAALPLPIAYVAAHTCSTPIKVHPSNPNNADTGCDGTSCPGNSGTLPHDHTNWLEGNHCRLERCWPPGHCRCPHPNPHAHAYGTGGSTGGQSDTVFGPGSGEFGAGVITVTDTSTEDCDGDGTPGDFDGDYDAGVGGGFFGYGPWAQEPLCNYGLSTHGDTATVNDVLFGPSVAFVIGADDTMGPVVTTDPVTNETTCSTDGSITPGDPATDPTADPDDCLTPTFVGTGTTCGAGGDGGYWVFLSGFFVDEDPGVSVSNPPTVGSITA